MVDDGATLKIVGGLMPEHPLTTLFIDTRQKIRERTKVAMLSEEIYVISITICIVRFKLEGEEGTEIKYMRLPNVVARSTTWLGRSLSCVRVHGKMMTLASYLIRPLPRFCPEVYIGENGHAIKTCHGYRRHAKNKAHESVKGGINDIVVPVDTFHLQNMFQDVIKHEQRFDYNRIPAVIELSLQAGAELDAEETSANTLECLGVESLSSNDVRLVAEGTLKACEVLRSGVQKLLMVYPAKVCKYCSEIHVGPSGHKAHLCGVFKYESWQESPFPKLLLDPKGLPIGLMKYQRNSHRLLVRGGIHQYFSL